MSMYKCDGCKAIVDTDDFPDNWDSEGQFFCDPCIAAHEAEGRELAREHHMDLNANGCTCQWIGANGDPDQHIKRDHDCPTHGIDPDAARDARQDREMFR